MRSCLFILFILITQTFYSQSPDIDWQNTIGGNGDDQLVSIHATSDNGYILGGFSNSGISGDKIDPGSGFYDYWVVKLNSFGVIEWQKCIGGNFNDILTDLQPTLDGGYILGGFSNSVISGNKTESSIGGSVDYWVVKLNATGEIEWQNTIGGVGEDDLYSICVTMDNGYLLGGRSNSSISGDKSEASDEYFDYWVVKLNATGEIEWQNTIGGSEYDYLYKCVQVDGGYILGGMSTSHISGDKTDDCIGGSNDFWVLKLDNVGNIIWQKTFGGIGADWLTTIVQAPGQRLIFGGYSNSAISGNKTVANYDIIPPFTNDFWIINTDSVGNINWQNDIGGIDDDYLLQNEIDSSGLILGGYSKSGISGIKTTNNIGFEDYWTIYVDSVGNIVWQKTDGGWSGDKLESIDTTFDGGYILGGFSSSPISGDKTEETFGSNDYWVIKLHGNCNTEIFYADIDGDGFGNQLDSILACVSPLGFVSNNFDCNDTNSLINPVASEMCNLIDDNCNNEIDEGLPIQILYIDEDNDSFGNSLVDTTTCLTSILGYVLDSTDCNDNDSTVYPGAIEVANGIDDNCNKIIDEGLNAIANYWDEKIEIYPNPSSGSFFISINDANLKNGIINIFNIIGEEIYTLDIGNSNNYYITLDKSFKGVAFVKIQIGLATVNKCIYILK